MNLPLMLNLSHNYPSAIEILIDLVGPVGIFELGRLHGDGTFGMVHQRGGRDMNSGAQGKYETRISTIKDEVAPSEEDFARRRYG